MINAYGFSLSDCVLLFILLLLPKYVVWIALLVLVIIFAVAGVAWLIRVCYYDPRKGPEEKEHHRMRRRATKLARERYSLFINTKMKRVLDVVKFCVSDVVPTDFVDAALRDLEAADRANEATPSILV